MYRGMANTKLADHANTTHKFMHKYNLSVPLSWERALSQRASEKRMTVLDVIRDYIMFCYEHEVVLQSYLDKAPIYEVAPPEEPELTRLVDSVDVKAKNEAE